MMARRGVIPIREAQKAVWELWEFVWQALRDPDGSHTTHFATAALIKERAIEIKDKLATPHDGGCWYCCWYCHKTDENLVFSIEWDAYVHRACVREALERDPQDAEAWAFARELGIVAEIITELSALRRVAEALREAEAALASKYDDYEFGVAISEPNARRIVACVNACEDIPTEALEAGVVRELVEALEALVGEIEWEIGEEKWGRDPDALPMARAVLAKVRGEA